MTEERFYNDGKYIMQEGEVWVVAGGEHSADVIATALNELIEERNKLQFDYNMEILTRQSIEKENKKLKKVIKAYNNYVQTEITSKQRVIEAYDNYMQTLKEDGVLDD